MLGARKLHYEDLDCIAKSIAVKDISSSEMSEAILMTVIELYKSAKVEELFKDDQFETAYHSPVTSELEFIIARILYHYSQMKRMGWKILLRRQVGKTAPDVRIELGGRTLAVIEIKAKVGWVQSFFSPNQFMRDQERLKSGASLYDPDAAIQISKKQLSKYIANFHVSRDDIFLLLPTLAVVHRKKYETTVQDYCEYFGLTSGLPADSLILLSNNLNLDLSNPVNDLMPTGDFERMLKILDEKTKLFPQTRAAVIDTQRNQRIMATKRYQDRTIIKGEQPSVSYRFLKELVERGQTKTDAQFNDRLREGHSYTGASSGILGVKFFYVVGTGRTRSEIFINNPKNQIKNKQIFDNLLRHKGKIETSFGDSLSWERMDDKNACRIAYRMQNGGYGDNENRWREIQDEMTDAMVRLEKAFHVSDEFC